MSNLLKKDGLSRKQRVELSQVPGRFKVMDDQLDSLLQKVTFFSQFVNYYNLQNKKQGNFHQMIAGSVIMVLVAIKRIDFDAEEKRFLSVLENNFTTSKENEIIDILLGWIKLYESWVMSSVYTDFKLTLRSDLVNQVVVNLRKPVAILFHHIQKNFKKVEIPNLSSIWKWDAEGEEIERPLRFYKSTGYKLLNSIEFLKQNIELYENEIFSSGYNDPAIALITAFLKNHNTVIDAFNQRWKTYHHFYLDEILKAKTLKARPDSTFIQIIKSPEKKYLEIPEKMVFTTDDNVLFSNNDNFIVNNIQLKQVWGIQEETDSEIEPAGELNYVTALRKIDLSDSINATVDSPIQPIFEKKGEKNAEAEKQLESNYTSVGLTIRSASLLLKEGNRNVNLKLIPTLQAVAAFKQLVAENQEKWQMPEQEAIYKLLDDIFYLEITTETEWKNIAAYSVSFAENGESPAFEIKFSFNEEFPAILPLAEENYSVPAIRFLLNRNAWLFPYSWLKDFNFSAIKIKTEVEGLTNLQVFSELGKLDTSMPFYPFGMMPKKGSWMVLGSYEMALKKITSFDLTINWANLPEHENGFAGYYELYENEINNCSFTVVAEALKNRKWHPEIQSHPRFLFNTRSEDKSGGVAPYGELSAESKLNNIGFKDLNRQEIEQQDFNYNMFAHGGFFKLRISGPANGFGHSEFQKTLSDTLIKNIKLKKGLRLPNPPFVPQVEHISVNYSSEDEIKLGTPSGFLSDEVSYIHPFLNSSPDFIPAKSVFKLIPSYNSNGNLLLGLDGVNGGETIRLFMLLSPSLREISKQQFPQLKWFFGNGFHWETLHQNNILRDGTRQLTESGIIEINLPAGLPDLETSKDHLFWLRISIEKYVENISDVKGFYLHVTKAERILDENNSPDFESIPALSINKSEQKIPGLKEIIQLTNTTEGEKAEDKEMMRIRLSERISHRNRAVNARDFERLVLEKFPMVQKVKCLPFTDSKGNKPGVVTLAIIPQTSERSRTPKANSKLLIDIEDYLQNYTGMFTTIDAINPVYEYLQVKCKVTLRKSRSEGYYLRLLNREINNYIASWEEKNESPVFGNSISFMDLANFIRSRKYVMNVKNFSVLHLREKGNLLYELIELEKQHDEPDHNDVKTAIKILLNKHEKSLKELQRIRPSYPWAILVPMEKHLLVPKDEDQDEHTGINELEIGNTFVIS